MNFKSFFYTITFIVLLIASWYFTPTQQIWLWLDKNIFLTLNSSLKDAPIIQHILAFLNSRYGDWLFEIIVITAYLSSPIYDRSVTFKRRGLQLLFVIVFIALTQICINKLFISQYLEIHRNSSSIVLGLPVDLSVFQYPNNKVASVNSFPADHATTLFLCMFLIWRHFRLKTITVVLSVASLMMIAPRVIAGAHWFTDIIFGAMTVALIMMAFLNLKKYDPSKSII